MIKVFLVEDEKIIRKSIKNNVKWEENGFEFAGEAPDGEMALPMIEKLHPDIVITDIKMPFMDGLELSDILKKKMPKIQIIILSGYGEFDYAKEAIKIGVTDYLTKPVTGEQLLEALNKVKQKLDKKKRQEEDIKKLQKNIKTQMKNMRYQFFGNLIRGKISVSKLMEQGNELGIDLMAPAYNFMLFKIFSKNENDTEAVYDLRTKEDAIVEEVSSQFENMIVFHRVTEGYILMIKAQNKEETIQVAKEFIVKNYQEETLSLSDVADQVGLSSSHFSTTFKQETGKSFVEFLTSVRMDKAKEMLCFTDMKASQISYEVGYKDPHYFSYLFKKTQGCTPSEYRSRRM